MFTGLVEDTGRVEQILHNGSACRVRIHSTEVFADASLGDSIAINGCCLTIVALDEHLAEFEAGSETLQRTSLGDLQAGTRVNLERSLKVGDRMGGHFVTGHIDCVGKVLSRSDEGTWSNFVFSLPAAYHHHLAPKGSIAVEGVSLTVVDVLTDPIPQFSVALIPHTLSVTTLGSKQADDRVNLETDVLAKYVEQSLRRA